MIIQLTQLQRSCQHTKYIHITIARQLFDIHIHHDIPWNTFSCNYITISNTRNVMEFCVYTDHTTLLQLITHTLRDHTSSYATLSYNSSAITKKLFTHLLARGFRMCTVFIQWLYIDLQLSYSCKTVDWHHDHTVIIQWLYSDHTSSVATLSYNSLSVPYHVYFGITYYVVA